MSTLRIPLLRAALLIIIALFLCSACEEESRRKRPVQIDVDGGLDVSFSDTGEPVVSRCGANFTECGDECVVLSEHPRHCGQCDQWCEEGELCVDGGCVVQEGPCPESPCTGFSYCDASSGICRVGCRGPDSCAGDQTCDIDTRTCACPTGERLCDGMCASVNSVDACGSECRRCPTTPNGVASCEEGQCLMACEDGHKLCGGVCAPCPSSAQDTICDGQACVVNSCAAGQRECGGQCTACPTGHVNQTQCEANQCTIASCQSGYHLCGGQCVDSTSVDHCGTLCSPCPAVQGGQAGCEAGQCTVDCGASRPCAAGCCEWQQQAVDTESSAGSLTSMRMGTSGNPHIAYATTNLELKYADWTWNSGLVEGTGELLTDDVALVLRSGDAPVILYYRRGVDTLDNSRLAAMTYSNNQWIFRIIEVVGRNASGLDAGLASNGEIHAVYVKQNGSIYELRHARFAANAWVPATIGSVGFEGGRPALVVGDDDVIHLVYADHSTQNPQLVYARHASDGWKAPQPIAIGDTFSERVGVALDPSGRVVVAHLNAQERAVLSTLHNGTWTSEVVDPNTRAGGLSVAFAPDGTAHVAFVNRDAQTVMHGQKTDATWFVTEVSPGATVTSSTSIGLDAAGDPVISYRDGTVLTVAR